QRLLRGNSAVDHLGAFETHVAIAAWAGGLAEIGEQRLPPAARGFTQRDQRIEPLPLDALLLVGGLALVDLHSPQPDVAHAIEREGVGRQPVTAAAAGLLIITL